jgi:hypothetical protein
MFVELGFDSERKSEIFSSPLWPEHFGAQPASYSVDAGGCATGLEHLGHDAVCSP